MAADILQQITALPGVNDAADDARAAIDAVLWDRGTRAVAADLARLSALRGAWASAAIDGAEVPLDAVLSGAIEASPMGERVERTVALTAELPRLVEVYSRSPLQAWASMNTLLVGGTAPEQEVGRPRADSDAEDPLRIGGLPMAMECSQRLTALGTLVVTPTEAPAVVEAGVVHGELAVLRPFKHGSGPVARATVRLALAARGLDPDLLTIPEAGMFAAGRSKYVHALRAYASGTPDGLAQWLTWFSAALGQGARQAAGAVAEMG